ncbi:MAG: hypothetical protein Q9162_001815 [Coniocarpon cinnabarinum]
MRDLGEDWRAMLVNFGWKEETLRAALFEDTKYSIVGESVDTWQVKGRFPSDGHYEYDRDFLGQTDLARYMGRTIESLNRRVMETGSWEVMSAELVYGSLFPEDSVDRRSEFAVVFMVFKERARPTYECPWVKDTPGYEYERIQGLLPGEDQKGCEERWQRVNSMVKREGIKPSMLLRNPENREFYGSYRISRAALQFGKHPNFVKPRRVVEKSDQRESEGKVKASVVGRTTQTKSGSSENEGVAEATTTKSGSSENENVVSGEVTMTKSGLSEREDVVSRATNTGFASSENENVVSKATKTKSGSSQTESAVSKARRLNLARQKLLSQRRKRAGLMLARRKK